MDNFTVYHSYDSMHKCVLHGRAGLLAAFSTQSLSEFYVQVFCIKIITVLPPSLHFRSTNHIPLRLVHHLNDFVLS